MLFLHCVFHEKKAPSFKIHNWYYCDDCIKSKEVVKIDCFVELVSQNHPED